MNATTSLATVLVRSDIGVFRLHLGDGASEVATSLSNGHCFQVLPVFALPVAPKGIADRVAAFVAESGGNGLGNGWFAGVALDMLAAFMVRACIAGGTHRESAPERHKLPPAVEPEGFPEVSTDDGPRQQSPLASSICADIAGSRPDSPGGSGAPPHAPAAGEPERGGDSGEEEHTLEEEDEGVVDEIWRHVEGSPAAEADKAVDIRMALEQRLGKQEAKCLLACARATVAKQDGHKNRILRIGRTALKMRRASPS